VRRPRPTPAVTPLTLALAVVPAGERRYARIASDCCPRGLRDHRSTPEHRNCPGLEEVGRPKASPRARSEALQGSSPDPDVSGVKLILVVLGLAVLGGGLLGGRLSVLSRIHLRWPAAAIAGLALQLAPVPGRVLPVMLLVLSFALLGAFSCANLRIFGFPLVLAGTLLNLTVIAIDGGMPVARQALVASGQADALHALIAHGGAKHHLAGPGDRLVALGDVIALPPPVSQAVSVGDGLTYAGVVCVVIAGMTGRADGPSPEDDAVAGVAAGNRS
jgi:Family of unknown function (DUF5317)